MFNNPIFLGIFKYLYYFAPFWVPIVAISVFIGVWMRYVRADFILKQGSVLLEIRLPKEVNRSPKGMEIFLTALYQTGAASEVETYWQGKIRPWWSLELVSIDGQIHFYIWCHAKWKNLVEAQLYAQYPGIEIYEAEDYTKSVYHDPVEYPLWATYFTLTEKTVYPIMTYVDYGLDKEQEEEYKIDPMTSVLEYLGSLKRGEQVWIQILIQAHKKEKFRDGRLFSKEDWKKDIKREVEKIREEATTKVPGAQYPSFPNPTKGQIDKIAALEKAASKFAFECVIRGVYFPTKEAFSPVSINGLVGSFRQYSSNSLNGFRLGWFTDFDYPWQDFHRVRRNAAERGMLQAYKMRSIFHAPYKNFHEHPYILNTEELATIYHFPGTVAQTPSLPRVTAKKSEAPANLPV